MRRLAYILSLLVLLLIVSPNVSATVQSRDIIIIDKVEHKLNQVLLYLMMLFKPNLNSVNHHIQLTGEGIFLHSKSRTINSF